MVKRCQKKSTMQVFINNSYPQALLDECKYEQEKIKMENFIENDLEKKFF